VRRFASLPITKQFELLVEAGFLDENIEFSARKRLPSGSTRSALPQAVNGPRARVQFELAQYPPVKVSEAHDNLAD